MLIARRSTVGSCPENAAVHGMQQRRRREILRAMSQENVEIVRAMYDTGARISWAVKRPSSAARQHQVHSLARRQPTPTETLEIGAGASRADLTFMRRAKRVSSDAFLDSVAYGPKSAGCGRRNVLFEEGELVGDNTFEILAHIDVEVPDGVATDFAARGLGRMAECR